MREITEESTNRKRGEKLSSMHDGSFSGNEIMTVMVATKGKNRTERMPGKTIGHIMEHIVCRHMRPCQHQGSSYFPSTDKQYLCLLVEQTMKRPD